MKSRPTIFLSSVSTEFRSFRDAVENEIEMKGCFAENLPGFPPDYRTVEEMLTRKLTDSDAVIHIVGFWFGAEPNLRPPGTPRRSYTQMEFDIANRLGKPVYRVLSTAENVRDDPKPDEQPEDAEARQLQLAHREAVQKTNYLYYFFKDKAELCKLVAEIPPVQAAGFHADISHIIKYAPAQLIGRDAELALLSDAWMKVRSVESPPHVLTFVALGGEGKTSLVAKWSAKLADANWPGCDAAFAWSFYSQGTKEGSVASSDLFLKEALVFFGDSEMANSARMAVDKGKRLAELVGERRALLILDGLEPLQYPPTSPRKGELKDHGMAALLKGLAARNQGLCVATTRYSVADLKNYWQSTSPEIPLLRLSKEAGVALLKSFGVKGRQEEFETLVEDVKGHALTLNLFGTYLHDAHAGDIRKRDRVKLDEADAEEQGGHAFHVMDAYVKWFETGGKNEGENKKGQRAIAVLRLLGLFDRPATADCLVALLQAPAIPGLTEALVGMSEAQRNLAFTRLEEAKLLTVNRDAAGTLLSLDAHPLLREYFATRLRTQNPEAWRTAQRRLYEHLCENTKEGDRPTLGDLEPLYQAVAHGCQAENQCGAFHDVFVARIASVTGGGENPYSINRFGAYGEDLAARHVLGVDLTGEQLTLKDRAEALNFAGHCLRACGRLAEAVEPLYECVNAYEHLSNLDDSRKACIAIGTLSQILLTIGKLATALETANKGVTLATEIEDDKWKIRRLAYLGDVLHQMGRINEARAEFEKAALVKKRGESQPLLDELAGYLYSDLLLTQNERDAVAERTTRTLALAKAKEETVKLTVGLDSLALGRVEFQRLQTSRGGEKERASAFLNKAVENLIQAGAQHHLPRGFLARAAFYAWRNDLPRAQADLDEAWEIAERGPMRLFMADIHIYRARLFHAVTLYPWQRPKADLAAARKLIEQCGYWRRNPELEDAEAAARNWPDPAK